MIYIPRVVHFEIPVDNTDRAIKFYKDVFGWEIKKWDGPFEYWMVMTGSKTEMGIDGGLLKRDSEVSLGGHNAFVCTMDVDSLDAYIDKVKKNGGSVRGKKITIPQVGYMAYCTDTEGNCFGLMQSDEYAK